jgi:hypothetical protein
MATAFGVTPAPIAVPFRWVSPESARFGSTEPASFAFLVEETIPGFVLAVNCDGLWYGSMGREQLRLYCPRQSPYSFPDSFRRSIRKVQTHVAADVLMISRIEWIARNKRHVVCESRTRERPNIHTWWQGNPEKESTLRASPGDFGREKFLQSLQHYVATLAINAPNQLNVLVEKTVASNFECHELNEG